MTKEECQTLFPTCIPTWFGSWFAEETSCHGGKVWLPRQEASEERAHGESVATNAFVGECVICMDAAATHIVVPCGHQSLCSSCTARYHGQCPVCRGNIVQIIKVYTTGSDRTQ